MYSLIGETEQTIKLVQLDSTITTSIIITETFNIIFILENWVLILLTKQPKVILKHASQQTTQVEQQQQNQMKPMPL